MDRNDLLRRKAAAKAKVEPLLKEYGDFLNGIKDKDGNDRGFSAEELGKHEKLALDIESLNKEIGGYNAALVALGMAQDADDRTADELGVGSRDNLPHASEEYRERFLACISGGMKNPAAMDGLTTLMGGVDRFQALTGTSPSTGSVLLPTVLENQILTEAAALSPLLGISGRINLSGRTNTLPFMANGGLMAPRVESEAYMRVEPTLSTKTIRIGNFGGLFPVSNELLEDTSLLEAMFPEMWAQSYADTFEEYALKGTGGATGFVDLSGSAATVTLDASKVPTGLFLEDTATVPELVTAGSLTVAIDDILKLPLQIHARAEAGASWLISREFLQVVVTLKDTTGRPIWMPSLIAGQPSTLLGAPVYRSDRMGAATTAGAFPAIFGNFGAHRVAMKKGLTMKRSEHFYFGNNMMAFAADARWGAGVVLKKYLARLKVKP